MGFAARISQEEQPRDRLKPPVAREQKLGQARAVRARIEAAIARLQGEMAKPKSPEALQKLLSKNEALLMRVNAIENALSSGKVEDHHLSDHGLDGGEHHEDSMHDCLHHPELHSEFTSLQNLSAQVHRLEEKHGRSENPRPQGGFVTSTVQMGTKAHVYRLRTNPLETAVAHHF